MATLPRIARIRFDNGTGGTREWSITADVQDTPAGTAVVCTYATTAAGIAPSPADWVELQFLNDTGGLIRSVMFTASPTGATATFYFTDTGLAGGAPRSGTVELLLFVNKNTGTLTTQYNAESDANPATPPTGYNMTSDRGWIRGTTTVELSASNVSAGGVVPAKFGYSDTIYQRATLGARPYTARTLTVAVGAMKSGATNSTVGPNFDRTHTGAVDNAFPKTPTVYIQTVTPSNATLTGLPFTVFTATTAPDIMVEAKINKAPHFQIDDKTFGTPPSSKDVPSRRRRTDEIGYISTRMINVNGKGLNGLTYTGKLWDIGELKGDQANPVVQRTGLVTQAQGGIDGYGPSLTPWDQDKPLTAWLAATEVTGPAGAVGLDDLTPVPYYIIGQLPNADMQVAGGNYGVEFGDRHPVPGCPIIVGLAVFGTLPGESVFMLDAGTPAVSVARFNQTYGRPEFLEADGVTWTPSTGGVEIYFHPLMQSPGDPTVWIKVFTKEQTATWAATKVYLQGKAEVGGHTINGTSQFDVVGSANTHDKHAFDPTGLFK